MIKGLILAGMCALGGSGITQPYDGKTLGELDGVAYKELSNCSCSGDAIIDCSARYEIENNVYVLDADGKLQKAKDI